MPKDISPPGKVLAWPMNRTNRRSRNTTSRTTNENNNGNNYHSHHHDPAAVVSSSSHENNNNDSITSSRNTNLFLEERNSSSLINEVLRIRHTNGNSTRSYEDILRRIHGRAVLTDQNATTLYSAVVPPPCRPAGARFFPFSANTNESYAQDYEESTRVENYYLNGIAQARRHCEEGRDDQQALITRNQRSAGGRHHNKSKFLISLIDEVLHMVNEDSCAFGPSTTDNFREGEQDDTPTNDQQQ